MRAAQQTVGQLFMLVVPAGLMALLGATVTGVLTPQILRDLHSDLAMGEWLTTAYMLAAGIAILLSGWFVDSLGLRTAWLTAVGVYGIGALACSLSPDIRILIASRAVQGLGGGALEPLMLTAVARAIKPDRMGRVMGALGLVMEVGPLAGPTLGGWTVDTIGWRWLYVSFALAAVALFLVGCLFLLPTKQKPRPIDFGGLAVLTLANLVALSGFARGATTSGFDTLTMIMLAVSVGAFYLFVRRGKGTRADSIINFAIFYQKGFLSGTLIMALMGAAVMPLFFGLPQFYQSVVGLSPLASGALMIPYAIGTITSMPLMGYLVDRMQARLIVSSGGALAFAATTYLFLSGHDASIGALACVSLFSGFGLGSIASPTVATMYRRLPTELTGSASTILFSVVQLGGALGVAVLVILVGHHGWSSEAGSRPFAVPALAIGIITLVARRF